MGCSGVSTFNAGFVANHTGIAGLWIDEHMMHGSSGITTTFDNDILSSTPDFMVDGIEVSDFLLATAHGRTQCCRV